MLVLELPVSQSAPYSSHLSTAINVSLRVVMVNVILGLSSLVLMDTTHPTLMTVFLVMLIIPIITKVRQTEEVHPE